MKISEQLVRSVLPSDLGTKIPWRPWLQLAYFLLLISFVLGDCTDFQSVDQWLNHGGNLQNQRFAQYENKINVKSVSRLRIKWTSFIGASVSATASISDGNLYFPDWDGHLYALAEQTGAVVWKKNLTQLTGSAIAVKSRNTPAVAGELLLLGLLNPATILAVRRLDGSLVWSTQLDKHPNAIITMSGTVYNGCRQALSKPPPRGYLDLNQALASCKIKVELLMRCGRMKLTPTPMAKKLFDFGSERSMRTNLDLQPRYIYWLQLASRHVTFSLAWESLLGAKIEHFRYEVPMS